MCVLQKRAQAPKSADQSMLACMHNYISMHMYVHVCVCLKFAFCAQTHTHTQAADMAALQHLHKSYVAQLAYIQTKILKMTAILIKRNFTTITATTIGLLSSFVCVCE